MNNSLSQILKQVKPLDSNAIEAARARQNELTKPRGSLGQLEELSIK
ncbi:MAG: nicotinate-nucleotide--dimethylbenzimidazole phosphoribosyltransferase, partial [Dehalococcoidia bacterium]|nr:nicotinate-nucleotide--dimethylbenzimidazole phosphoribosyltransferase [Dehalococcoidia bacterium]